MVVTYKVMSGSNTEGHVITGGSDPSYCLRQSDGGWNVVQLLKDGEGNERRTEITVDAAQMEGHVPCKRAMVRDFQILVNEGEPILEGAVLEAVKYPDGYLNGHGTVEFEFNSRRYTCHSQVFLGATVPMN